MHHTRDLTCRLVLLLSFTAPRIQSFVTSHSHESHSIIVTSHSIIVTSQSIIHQRVIQSLVTSHTHENWLQLSPYWGQSWLQLSPYWLQLSPY